jgi:hypothetical protein
MAPSEIFFYFCEILGIANRQSAIMWVGASYAYKKHSPSEMIPREISNYRDIAN